MSHLPFETWIFSDEPLDEEQQQLLDKHLESCQECHALSEAMASVNNMITTSDSPIPSPGFAQRWHERLSLHRQREKERRTWLITIGVFVLANIILLGLIFLDLTTINWSYEFGRMIVWISLITTQSRNYLRAITNITSAFPVLLPVLIISAVGLFSAAVVLMVTWIRSMMKLIKTN